MELIIFLSCVLAVALLIAVWGAIQLHKMDFVIIAMPKHSVAK